MNAKKRAGRAPSEPTELRRTVARNLRLARDAALLLRNDLAVAASCDHAMLANIETNAANMTLDTLTRLANALGLTEIDLLLPNLEQLDRLKHVVRTQVSRRPRESEPTELRRRLARNLLTRRRKEKLLQRQVAAGAGISLSLIVDIEVHCQNVTLDTVTRLAITLDCTEIDLLGPAPANG